MQSLGYPEISTNKLKEQANYLLSSLNNKFIPNTTVLILLFLSQFSVPPTGPTRGRP